MQTKEHALQIINRLIMEAHQTHFSYVAIKAKTVADILQAETGEENHAMPTVCNALRDRFREGRDFFRRGKEKSEWHTSINGSETSTFEVLFEIVR